MIPPRLHKHLAALLASFWLAPLSMLSAGVAAGVILPLLDAAIGERGIPLPGSLAASASGARSILSAAATALATILAVAFSMTMLTVQLAATQYTSRLLRRFMGDGITKSVLGLYLATVAFLLLVLRSVRSQEDEGVGFVPTISVLVGIVLTLACLAALLVSLHRTTSSLQVATVLASLTRETLVELTAVDERWQASDAPMPSDRVRCRIVRAVETGYLQRIDVKRVAAALPDDTTWLTIDKPVGSFVCPGMPLVAYGPAEDSGVGFDDASLHRAFAVGRQRTLSRDPLYGVRQLVDIALKALSPAVNDPTTAVMVVNELGVIVGAALRQRLPVEPWASRTIGGIHVLQQRAALGPLLAEAYGELVVYARTHPRVLTRIADTLTEAVESAGVDTPACAVARRRASAVRAEATAAHRRAASESTIETTGRSEAGS